MRLAAVLFLAVAACGHAASPRAIRPAARPPVAEEELPPRPSPARPYGDALANAWFLGEPRSAMGRGYAAIAEDLDAGRARWVLDAYDCATHTEPTAAAPVCVRAYLGHPSSLPATIACSIDGVAGTPTTKRGEVRFEGLAVGQRRAACTASYDGSRWDVGESFVVEEIAERSAAAIVELRAPRWSAPFVTRSSTMAPGSWLVPIVLTNTATRPVDRVAVACAVDGAPIETMPAGDFYPDGYRPWSFQHSPKGTRWLESAFVHTDPGTGDHVVECRIVVEAPTRESGPAVRRVLNFAR